MLFLDVAGVGSVIGLIGIVLWVEETISDFAKGVEGVVDVVKSFANVLVKFSDRACVGND